jgi:tetratricopeptide (TPR) repeat protein
MAASGRNVAASSAALVLLLLAGPGPLPAQQTGGAPALPRALDLEAAGKCREALPLYRQALGEGGEPAGALLGLERCAMEAALPDTLLAILDSVLARRPRDPTARTVHLRTLISARRFDQAAQGFDQWVSAVPRDPAPYREYARILLDQGRVRTADTVLEQATRALGTPREIAAELAELRGALGMWESSARSWRDAMSIAPYLEQSAIFVLTPAPDSARDSIRAVLAAPPADLHTRRILAGLELRWRSAREAWNALRELAPTDSVVAAWIEFAGQAEERDAWLVARDAYLHAMEHGRAEGIVVRAATAALQGGESESALMLLSHPAAATDTASAGTVALLRLRALSQLGRAAEAESLLALRGSELDPVTRGDAVRAVAWGWVRRGDPARARAVLERGAETWDERSAAWLALYEGDLKAARTGLRRLEETTRDAVLALALLSRTRADTSTAVGAAFLALARGDTAGAAGGFQQTAAQLSDATPLLLNMAARLYLDVADTTSSVTLWQRIVEGHAEAPEAAEAELAWARVLRRRGDGKGAIAHLEHLILTYPTSALVPQARRELELARGNVPPGF